MSGETWKTAVGAGHTWVFTGYLKPPDHACPEPEPQGLEPVRYLVVSTPSNAVKDKDKPQAQALLMTDASGLLHLMPDEVPKNANAMRLASVHYFPDGAHFTIVPPELVRNAYAAHEEKWPGQLRELMTRHVAGQQQESMQEMKVRKKHLRLPLHDSDNADEKAYAKFYDSVPSDGPPMAALVFARTRAAVFVFTDPAFERGKLLLTSPKGKTFEAQITTSAEVSAKPTTALLCAVVVGSKKDLEPGLYQIEVAPPPSAMKSGWRPGLKSYVLHEVLRFEISNLAGEFDVVQMDPISVEETLLLQFPSQYAHRLEAATQRVLYEAVGQPSREFPEALEPWAERLAWAHAKSKMIVDRLNGDDDGPKTAKEALHEKPKLVGSAVWNAIKAKYDKTSVGASMQAISLYYDFAEKVKDWKKAIKGWNFERFAAANEVIRELPKEEGVRALRLVTKAFMDGDEAVLVKIKGAKDLTTIKAATRPKQTALQEKLGKAGARVEKAVVVVGVAVDVVNTAVAFNKLVVAHKQRQELAGMFAQLAGQVDDRLHRAPSREAIGTLERARTAAVAAELGLEEAEGDALMAALDLVLGVLTLVGVGGVALGIVVLAKSTFGLVTDGVEWVDQWLCRGALADLVTNQRQMKKLYDSSRANQTLVPKKLENGGKDDLQTQFVLRAEVLTGLVRLFMRASQSTEVSQKDPAGTEKQYLENVKRYRIQEYVERFLFRDGWQFPLRPLVPVGMDTVWLYLTGQYSQLATVNDMDEALGFSRPLALATPIIPGGMLMLAVASRILERNALANFGETFPVHRMDAVSFDDLAKAFRTSWPEIEKDGVEFTALYTRPRGSTDDAAWQPVNRKGVEDVDQLDLLSPYDQLRVLVVFKEHVTASGCPASLQLFRVDGVNLSGPVYKELTRTLQEADFADEETRKWAGKRQGCVFHPHFRYGHEIVPGTKPLSWTGWGLGSMRYGFRLKLGSKTHDPFITIGGPKGAASKLDEFRVGITGKPQEDLLKERSFLARECNDVQYPALSEHRNLSRFVACYARVGRGPWKRALLDDAAHPPGSFPRPPPPDAPPALPTEGIGKRVFPDYDWKTPVEIVVVLTAYDVRWKAYEDQGFDWSRLPVDMNLHESRNGSSHKGPPYGSMLEYVAGDFISRGRLERVPSAFGSRAPARIPAPGPEVSEWAAQMQGKELEKLLDVVQGGYADQPRDMRPWHLWAAHFKIDAVAPNGRTVDGFRPFGAVRTNKPGMNDECYWFSVRNVTTSAEIGAAAPSIKGQAFVKEAQRAPCEFFFVVPAPTEGKEYAWGKMDPKDASLKSWIKDYGTQRDPRVRITRPTDD